MESIDLEQLQRSVSPEIFRSLAGSDSTEAELPHTTPTESEPTIINQLEAELDHTVANAGAGYPLAGVY